MQDSFLQNDDDNNTNNNQKRSTLSSAQRKIYQIQFSFLTLLKQQMNNISEGIQSTLISLTNYQQSQKKRLPYTILRNFENNLKQMKVTKQKIIKENHVYSQYLQNREKQKVQRNAEFKFFLQRYGKKRQQLKKYMSSLQTRVRKLEDSGYAQYIQFDVVVPEVNTIRFSFSARTLLSLIESKVSSVHLIVEQMSRRKKLNDQIQKQLTSTNQNQDKNQNTSKQNKCHRIRLLSIQQQSQLVLKYFSMYLTYKYLSNDCIMALDMLKCKAKREQLLQTNQSLKSSLHFHQELLYKKKLANKFISDDPTSTKTDHLILFRQYQRQIKTKLQSKIFYHKLFLYQNRSKSCQNIKHINL